jgi:hypothetical protein
MFALDAWNCLLEMLLRWFWEVGRREKDLSEEEVGLLVILSKERGADMAF